jgi:hypothetical protein
MKRLFMVLSSIGLFCAIAFARSPKGNWQAVEDLPIGWRIAVVTDFTFPCIFIQATHDQLTCSVPRDRGDEPRPQVTHVHRSAIREIRADRRNGANALAAAGLGTGAGAIFGVIATSSTKGPLAYFFGLAGGLMGAHTGRDVHVLRGKVIYRAPAPAKQRSKVPDPIQASQVVDVISQTSP